MRVFTALSVAALSAQGFAQSYESLSACEKERILWNQIEASQYEHLPRWTGLEPGYLAIMAINPIRSIVRDFFGVTMDRQADELPDGRFKHIHTYGSVARIAFESDAEVNPYTGLFQGAECGLIRLSAAAKPLPDRIIPGASVKFLVDGLPSKNFVALYSIDGQEGHDFFKNTLSNFVAPPSNPALMVLAQAFATTSRDPFKVDVEYMANWNSNGRSPAQPHGPEQVFLVPNHDALQFSDDAHEVREDFVKIPAGTTLYSVYGRSRGENARHYLGRIVTKSPFLSSKFGDLKLFFRHERFQGR